ncbi:MAG TPA: SDR family oxidoreductase [Candidatus Binatia bacterium]|nr:SDR family oxidoreductase [Candidatus Binatia bacterium]
MGKLEGKVCVVTGGAGSIGLASARLFAREGASVMLVDVRESELKTAHAALGGGKAAYCVADVSRSDQVKGYVDKTVATFGKIDVLFSNAGNFGGTAPIEEFSEENFDAVMAVHVRGGFLACKHGLPQMNEGGSVIITSSTAGLRGGGGGACAYTTAKHALVGLMRCVSKETAGRRIRVNTLHPGPVDNAFQLNVEKEIGRLKGFDATQWFNQMIPMHRHAAPEEIAKAALFLASDDSSFITGTTFVVDGGLNA